MTWKSFNYSIVCGIRANLVKLIVLKYKLKKNIRFIILFNNYYSLRNAWVINFLSVSTLNNLFNTKTNISIFSHILNI